MILVVVSERNPVLLFRTGSSPEGAAEDRAPFLACFCGFACLRYTPRTEPGRRSGRGRELLQKERRELEASMKSAASAIESADALIITAGAGMGSIPGCRITAATRASGAPARD